MKKLKIYILSLIVVIFFSCSVSMKKDQNQYGDSHVSVKLLNDVVQLPKHDQLRCIDTLYFEIQNNSRFDYYYATPDSSFIFCVGTDAHYGNFGMIECAGIEFFDEDSMMLNTYAHSMFNPEVNERPILYKKDIVVIPSMTTKTIKMFLKFPNIVADWEPIYQFVPRLKYAKTVNVIFKPNMTQTQKYLNENRIKLKSNEKLMNVYFEFQKPVKFKCNWGEKDNLYKESNPIYKHWDSFLKAVSNQNVDYLVKNSTDSIDIVKENYKLKSTDTFKYVFEKNDRTMIIDTVLQKSDSMSFDQFFSLFEEFDEKEMIAKADSLELRLQFDTMTNMLRLGADMLFTDFLSDIFLLDNDDFYITSGFTDDGYGRDYFFQKIHYVLKDKEIIYTMEEKEEKLLFREMKIVGRQYFENQNKKNNIDN